MKKALTLLLLILVLTSTACNLKSRIPITAQEFVAKMEAAGFDLVDATNQFEAGKVDAVYIAVGENYQVEFYVVPSVDQAKGAFATNKSNFEEEVTGSSSNKTIEVKNYSSFTQTASDTYYVVSRTDNTFIYVVADADYKKEISELISDLGY